MPHLFLSAKKGFQTFAEKRLPNNTRNPPLLALFFVFSVEFQTGKMGKAAIDSETVSVSASVLGLTKVYYGAAVFSF